MTRKCANPKPKAQKPVEDVGTSSRGKAVAVEEEAPEAPGKVIENPQKYTASEMCDKLEGIPFLSTRYPHTPTLTALGLLDDYNEIVENMGLKEFFNLASDSYQSSACQFLSTMQATVNMRRAALAGEVSRGKIDFQMGRKKFSMTYEDIAAVFDFPENGAQLGTFST